MPTKQWHGKTTPETAKHPTWIEVATGIEKTAILWRKWARDNGLLTEKEGKTVFNIVNGNGTLIKTLERS